jgi:hypothetical protein
VKTRTRPNPELTVDERQELRRLAALVSGMQRRHAERGHQVAARRLAEARNFVELACERGRERRELTRDYTLD